MALLALYALIVATAAVLAWRASRLSGIPDIGDPFDTDRLLAWKVPDERNAYVFYRKAHEAIHHDHEVEKTLPGYRGGPTPGRPSVRGKRPIWRPTRPRCGSGGRGPNGPRRSITAWPS